MGLICGGCHSRLSIGCVALIPLVWCALYRHWSPTTAVVYWPLHSSVGSYLFLAIRVKILGQPEIFFAFVFVSLRCGHVCVIKNCVYAPFYANWFSYNTSYCVFVSVLHGNLFIFYFIGQLHLLPNNNATKKHFRKYQYFQGLMMLEPIC